MKLTAAVAMAVLGTNVGTGQSVQDGPKVTVCLSSEPTAVRFHATAMASQMYSAVGVTLDWQSGSRACKAAGAIHIELTDHTPDKLMPGALAYALPYEGIHIRVFLDRVEQTVGPRALPYLLAHVLVHEIGHILQGINRHSETGVMKAHWVPDDYGRMQMGYLPFTREDVTLIHAGLDRRAAQQVASRLDSAIEPRP